MILPLAGLFDAEKELARLAKQRAKIEKDLAGLVSKLGNQKVRNLLYLVSVEICDIWNFTPLTMLPLPSISTSTHEHSSSRRPLR